MPTELLRLLGLRANFAEPKANLVTPLVGSTQTTVLLCTWRRCFVGQVESNRLAKLRCLSLRHSLEMNLWCWQTSLDPSWRYLSTCWQDDTMTVIRDCSCVPGIWFLLTFTCSFHGQGAPSQGALLCLLLTHWSGLKPLLVLWVVHQHSPHFNLQSNWFWPHHCDPGNSQVSWTWLAGPSESDNGMPFIKNYSQSTDWLT